MTNSYIDIKLEIFVQPFNIADSLRKYPCCFCDSTIIQAMK